ncbi:hypothetical protein [Nocardiopsis sp. LOL_012]|uniref:hypothetical protein n=1 Tax=Nocardiopsis sp. LOL_012 TaxID=3345409 RepID=UPI003A8BE3FC
MTALDDGQPVSGKSDPACGALSVVGAGGIPVGEDLAQDAGFVVPDQVSLVGHACAPFDGVRSQYVRMSDSIGVSTELKQGYLVVSIRVGVRVGLLVRTGGFWLIDFLFPVAECEVSAR